MLNNHPTHQSMRGKYCYLFIILIHLFIVSCSDDPDSGMVYVIPNHEFGIRSDKTDAQATTDGINRAIEHAKAEGYLVAKLSPGDYLIDCVNDPSWYPTKGVFVPTNMILDLGEARLHAAPNSSNHYALIQIDHVENAAVVGGHLIGDRGRRSTAGTAGYGIQIISSSNVSIRNVRIEGMTGDGIVSTFYTYMLFFKRFPTTNLSIYGCDISDCGKSGIHLIHAKGVDIADNHFHNILKGSHQYAIDTTPDATHSLVEDVKIHRNLFQTCTNGAMRLWGGTDMEVYENRMEDIGIFSVSPQRVHIHRNVFTGKGGMYISNTSVDICAPLEGDDRNECQYLTDLSKTKEGFSCR